MKYLKIFVLSTLLSACNNYSFGPGPSLGELTVDGIGMDHATLRSLVENPSMVKDAGFMVSDTSSYLVPVSADGAMELELKGLRPGTGYSVVAFIGNGVNTKVSQAVTFETSLQFPDEAFRNYVLSNYDLDNDGILSETEAAVVDELSVPTETMYDVESADGIGIFKNLRTLSLTGSWDGKTGLQSLDLSGMTRLSSIYLMWGRLQSLTLPAGVRSVNTIALDYNFLTEADFKDLEQASLLQVSYNNIKSLDLSKFNRIDQLSCIGNDLSELDLSSITVLGCLLCYDNPNLKTVKVNSKCNIHQLEVDSWTTVIYVD